MNPQKRKARRDGRGIFDERLDTLIVSPSSRQMQGSHERKTIPTATAAMKARLTDDIWTIAELLTE
jgi:hypothetical protein